MELSEKKIRESLRKSAVESRLRGSGRVYGADEIYIQTDHLFTKRLRIIPGHHHMVNSHDLLKEHIHIIDF